DTRMAAAPGPKWTNHAGRPSMVFVAPEYMFLREGFDLSTTQDFKRNRFLDAVDGERIINGLKALGAEFGKQLVFVPGSIASRKPIPRNRWDAEDVVESAKQDVRTGAEFVQGSLMGRTGKARMTSREAGEWAGYEARTPRMKLHTLEGMLQKN